MSRYPVTKTCGYCWATFTTVRDAQTECSPECSKSVSAWDAWIAKTRRLAATGDVRKPINLGPKHPAGGKRLAVVERFRVESEAAA